MFRPVSSRLNTILLEEQTLNFWRLHRIFEKAGQQGQGRREYVFYEQPPAAHSRPELQHALRRAGIDVFARYRQMRGDQVIRRSGWETHGLALELKVEQQLGFTRAADGDSQAAASKGQIEAYGIERFNGLCRQSAFAHIQEWERFTDRLGFWVDMREAYVTYTNDYIESVWWVLKTLWERKLMYQAQRVMPYCARCGTSFPNPDTAPGSAAASDMPVLVRLPLVDQPGVSLLAWTGAVWTLPGSVAVAVQAEAEYVTVEADSETGPERLVLARSQVEQVFGSQPVKVVDSHPGRRLKGQRYRPLFTFLPLDKPANVVVLQDGLAAESSSGLALIAPAYHPAALQTALENDLPVLAAVIEDGAFIPDVRPWSGRPVRQAAPLIAADLRGRGLLFRGATAAAHGEPPKACRHCGTPLIPYARSAWFLRTSQHSERLQRLAGSISRAPAGAGKDSLSRWLDQDTDWAISRTRFWGTPLPVWECSQCRHQLAVGSLGELAKLAGRDLSGLDLHRPQVDQVTFPCPRCASGTEPAAPAKIRSWLKRAGGEKGHSPGQMRRVPDLVDAGFDAGAMPAAQWHFPYENRDAFRAHFPADLVCEPLETGQGWFYALHATAALLFDSPAYKNLLGLELPPGADPWRALSAHGADALRWYFYTAAPNTPDGAGDWLEQIGALQRRLITPLWETYAFFVACANRDRWTPQAAGLTPGSNPLDRWLRSELQVLVNRVTRALDTYDLPGATRPVQAFVENVLSWYLRRSRQRFWAIPGSEPDPAAAADRDQAYAVLYESLVTLSQLLAPAMPFLAEALYQNLKRSHNGEAAESVHLSSWPAADTARIDPELNQGMRLVMRLAALGNAARTGRGQSPGVKAHQVLAGAGFALARPEERPAVEQFAPLLADALNARRVTLLAAVEPAGKYHLEPHHEVLKIKYHSLYPQIAAAIEALTPGPASRSLLAGQPVQIKVEGIALDIQPDEIELSLQVQPGSAAASDGPYLALLDTSLTPELTRLGLVNEFVRRIQEMRQTAELEVGDQIRIYVQATPDLQAAVEAQRAEVLGESGALDLLFGEPPAGLAGDAAYPAADAWFEGQWMKAVLVADS